MIFFSKKLYLVDFLEGFVDIHNHILPGLDDGAKNVEDSLDIISEFMEFGVHRFICTPHIMHNYYDNTPKTIKNAYKTLKQTLSKEERYQSVNLKYAAEHMIDDNFEKLLKKEKFLSLNKRNMLVEMSYLQPSINFDIAIKKIKEKNYFPVLAHPERYQYLTKSYNMYSKYKQKNIYFQLNMLSLSSYYGNSVKKNALKLLDDGMFDFLGSDIHNVNQLTYLKNEVTLKKKILNKVIPLIHNTIENFY